jgi:hypothetical protein
MRPYRFEPKQTRGGRKQPEKACRDRSSLSGSPFNWRVLDREGGCTRIRPTGSVFDFFNITELAPTSQVTVLGRAPTSAINSSTMSS